MVNKPKSIGTAAETAVVRFARANGFPLAERRALAGAYDIGDVLLTAFTIVEVKAGKAAEHASDNQILAWLDETETERRNANAEAALLVTKRAGKGHANAGQWWTHWRLGHLAQVRGYPVDLTDSIADDAVVRMTLASALAQLRAGGYGDPMSLTDDTTTNVTQH
ncbi:hypothetical protein [Xylanimonas ulmi]|uniref:Holliday junction resolvase n=1 Tax=Xylanimonas ulmi TaxID=228973 RepID=A0A4Q7M2Z1_9MICO|nr:hypothetical protein [Xylanibacterium ulmi]RZS61671.1 hypothetical protein EV386_1981 [Xylanibacterium ulmi]